MNWRRAGAVPAASATPAAERMRRTPSIAPAIPRNLVSSTHGERPTYRDRRGFDRGDADRRPLPRAHAGLAGILQRVRADSLPRPRRDRMVSVARRASRDQRAETDPRRDCEKAPRRLRGLHARRRAPRQATRGGHQSRRQGGRVFRQGASRRDRPRAADRDGAFRVHLRGHQQPRLRAHPQGVRGDAT